MSIVSMNLDRYGLTADDLEEDGSTVRSGRVVRVPMHLADSLQRAVKAHADRVTRKKVTRDPKGRILSTSEEEEMDDMYDRQSLMDAAVADACERHGLSTMSYSEARKLCDQARLDAAKRDEEACEHGSQKYWRRESLHVGSRSEQAARRPPLR